MNEHENCVMYGQSYPGGAWHYISAHTHMTGHDTNVGRKATFFSQCGRTIEFGIGHGDPQRVTCWACIKHLQAVGALQATVTA